MFASKEATAILFVIIAAGSWGVAGVLSKYALGLTSPFQVLLIELSFSMFISWIIVAITYESVEFARPLLSASALGILHPGLSSILGIVGLSHLDASVSSTIWALEAPMTMILASLILVEKLSVIQIAMSLLSVFGVFLTATHHNESVDMFKVIYGTVLVVVAVLSCALYAVLSRQIVADEKIDPLFTVAAQQTTGLLLCLAMLPLHWSFTRLGDLGALSSGTWLVCIITGTLTFLVATGLFLAGLRHLSAARAGSLLILTPVFGLATAYMVLGEKLTAWQWIGVTIILLSVLGIQSGGSHSNK